MSSGLADINVLSRNGDTPLHRCAALGLPIITAFFMLYGANTAVLNAHNQTPLDVANSHGYVATALVLSSPQELFVLATGTQTPVPAVRDAGSITMETLNDVLRSIWNSAHHVRDIVAACRTVPFSCERN